MGSACSSLCGQAVEPPTRCAEISVTGLRIMNVFQLVILASAFATEDWTNGIVSIIFVIVLFCAWRFLQYRIVVSYALYTMFLFMMSLVWLLTRAQQNVALFPQDNMGRAKAAFQLIYCVYYFVVSIICFFIYRQFKAISFQKNPAILKYFNDRNNSMNDNAEMSGSVGEDNKFAPTYGQMPVRGSQANRNHNNQNNRQVNQVFAGKGVVIGGS